MGKDSLIQWCDSTVNPTTGCDGCELWAWLDALRARKGGSCYAGNYQETRMAKAMPKLYAADFTEVRMAPGRMAEAAKWSDLTGIDRPDKPWLNGSPRVIFIGDMGDVLSEAVTFDYLADEIIDVVESPRGMRHIWMLLTKRPNRLAKFAEWLDAETGGRAWPSNLWVGTSVTNQHTTKRIEGILCVPGATRFVSFEPLRERVRFATETSPHQSTIANPISLAIIGGESRQGKHEPTPFDIQWARDLIADCRRLGISPFVKQLGSRPVERAHSRQVAYPYCTDSHGGDWSEWPGDLRVREFPAPRKAVANG